MSPKKASTNVTKGLAKAGVKAAAKLPAKSASKKASKATSEVEEVEEAADTEEEAISQKHKAALEATKRAIAEFKAKKRITKKSPDTGGTEEASTNPEEPVEDGKTEPVPQPVAEEVLPSPKRARKVAESTSPLKDEEREKVQDLLSRISDVNSLQRYAFAKGYDAVKIPLSKVSKDMVREAFTWLKAIERELSRPEPSIRSLEAMSKSFYAVVPLRDCEGQDCISSADIFQTRLRVVDMLSDIEAAHVQWKLLLSAAEQAASEGSDAFMQSFDKLHQGLKCTLKSELPGSHIWNIVDEYVQNSRSESSSKEIVLRSVFNVHRPAETVKFGRFAKNPNRALLWHGTRLTGCLSLLANGPRIPPKEAPDKGYSFGKGLYFWDAASPAIALCDAESEGCSNRAMLLLAEVALGNVHRLTQLDGHANKLPQGTQSVTGQGMMEPDPLSDRRLEDGVRLPIGKIRQLRPASPWQHNQFVVYNAAQVRMRYLVEVELVAKT